MFLLFGHILDSVLVTDILIVLVLRILPGSCCADDPIKQRGVCTEANAPSSPSIVSALSLHSGHESGEAQTLPALLRHGE